MSPRTASYTARSAPRTGPSSDYGRSVLRQKLFEQINRTDSTPFTILATLRQAQRTFGIHDRDFDLVVNESVYYPMLRDAMAATESNLV